MTNISEHTSDEWNSRTLRLIGEQGVKALSELRVLIAGVGGVGGYVAEMLARSGAGHLTLIDSDTVAPSNLNRQIIALTGQTGQPKVALFKERIAHINPECEVTAVEQYLTADNVEAMLAPGFDFVADCIDTVAPKVALLAACKARKINVISSMGAGGRMDPTRVQYADLWETQQDGLARAVREAFKRRGRRPSIKVVYSSEPPRSRSLIVEQNRDNKRTGYGTLATIPALFGIYMASYIINKSITS
ncbi:MAG: tRNA threonylcarbamoyladenosine dehydratase [Prevotella sp.]|nr:tRNA threonylcarbamoyladenosine dehydratase [Prevotella sp.]MCM1075408.1 tRNA threonylcarbamoyladenosine dehydratase [Ruminococcus sp.]